MTIVEAIMEVMSDAQRPLTARQAFTAIVEKSLYEFHAKDPLHVVTMQILTASLRAEWPCYFTAASSS